MCKGLISKIPPSACSQGIVGFLSRILPGVSVVVNWHFINITEVRLIDVDSSYIYARQ